MYHSIGPERKAARLRYLRNRWAKRLLGQKGITIYTSFDPAQSCCIATVGIDGVKPADLSNYLFNKCRILVTPIEHEQISGIRITPNTYTTLREVDRFSEAMEHIIRNGLPT